MYTLRFPRRASACLSGTALGETIAVAVHFEDADVMGYTVQQGTRQTFGA